MAGRDILQCIRPCVPVAVCTDRHISRMQFRRFRIAAFVTDDAGQPDGDGFDHDMRESFISCRKREHISCAIPRSKFRPVDPSQKSDAIRQACVCRLLLPRLKHGSVARADQ